MTHSDSPFQVRPASDCRRAERVRPGPLRVRLHRMCEGNLIDISEFGALVQLSCAPAPEKHLTLQLEWNDETLRIRTVRRSSPA